MLKDHFRCGGIMSTFKDGNLEITIQEGDKNIMTWLGKSDARDPVQVLNNYFSGVIDKLKGKELEIHFEKLEYMNSSSIVHCRYLLHPNMTLVVSHAPLDPGGADQPGRKIYCQATS